MKKYIAITLLLFVFLAAFIPFASSNPDGLEKVAASFGVEETSPLWHGLMSDYTVNALGENYASTLAAGTLGTVFVLVAGLVLGTTITKHSQTRIEKS